MDAVGKLKVKTLAIDFDGVIYRYSKGFKENIYDPPVEGACEALRAILRRGYHVIIYTAYPKSEEIKPWLEKYLEKKYVNQIKVQGGKPTAFMYIDDRAVRFTTWKDMFNYLR